MAEKQYVFREAREEDLAQMKWIRDHVKENRLVTLKIELPDYKKALFEDGKGWTALYDNKVIGFSCGRLKQKDVWALFIDQTHEGHGVGNRLMQLLEEWMFSKGLKEIRLSTQPGTRAERLYRKRGWLEQAEREGQDIVFKLAKN